MSTHPAAGDRRDLRADCERCFALCCVVPAFAASADFAFDKPAEQACRHLGTNFRCAVHSQLRQRGCAGCAVYDCFGAGQKVSQVTFGGSDWRTTSSRDQMFAVFPIMRQLHELLWYLTDAIGLTDALGLAAARHVHADLIRAWQETECLTQGGPEALVTLDVAAYRALINPLLVRASDLVRAGASGRPKDRRGADLIGAHLKQADLRGANLRGAYLIGADLRGADLTLADLMGADLRAADLRGADLEGCIFLIQSQLDAARGDDQTQVPASLHRPAQWSLAGARDRGR
jgi:uncharacterized protein YjbI with pentapeptide repeats